MRGCGAATEPFPRRCGAVSRFAPFATGTTRLLAFSRLTWWRTAARSQAAALVQALVLTDIATGWAQCARLLGREQGLLGAVLTEIREHLPFAVLGFYTDNDSSCPAYRTNDRRVA